jgi:hypothetical protein
VTAALSAAFGADITFGLETEFTAGVEMDIATGLSTNFSSSVPPGVPVDPAKPTAPTAALPSITANLLYEDRVEVKTA